MVGSGVAGLVKGISFISPNAEWTPAGHVIANVLAGGFGAVIGAALGAIPGAVISGSSKSLQKRQTIKTERLANFIKNNPQLPGDLEKFVNNLISQTPDSILKMSNYITYLMIYLPEIDREEGFYSTYISMTGDETERRTKELVKLVKAYFLQQEQQWEKIASTYNVHPDTLYQIYNSLNQNGIENRWLEGIKNKITAPKQGVTEESVNQGVAEATPKKLKTGPAAHFTPKDKHVKVGQFVGGMEESKSVNCIPLSEHVENIMDALINKIIVNEAIQNNRK
jgi:hypothetical protein